MSERATAAIAARRDFTLGEARVAFRDGRAELRGPRAGTDAVALAPTVEALRERVRFDDRGRYRPLSGARTLPGGWRVSLPEELAAAAIEAVYPQALLHREQAARGTLRIATFADVIARQRGRYRVAGELGGEGRERARDALCGQCVRTPAWAGEGAPDDDDAIPCPEPCSVLVALCREAALWEREPPEPVRPDPAVAFADFAAAGNEIREAYLAGAAHG